MFSVSQVTAPVVECRFCGGMVTLQHPRCQVFTTSPIKLP
jgi:hypothetical protein